jgi:hypothetical protein
MHAVTKLLLCLGIALSSPEAGVARVEGLCTER